MSMKLVGEYELTDDGVKIEGKILNSHIAEIRTLFKPFLETKMYCGEKPNYTPDDIPMSYCVPHPQYRAYVRRVLPGVITPEKDKRFIKMGQSILDRQECYYSDAQTFTHNLGVQYGSGEGRSIMDTKTVFNFSSMKRNKSKLLTNSAWVWNAKSDGDFKIELLGLINKHMMTVVLANATKLARYIDEVLVGVLDHPEKFTEDAVYCNVEPAHSSIGARLRPIPASGMGNGSY